MRNVTAKMAGLSEERHKKGRGRINLKIKYHQQIVQKTTTVAVQRYNKGLCKEKKSKIRHYYGSEWVGPGLTRNFFCLKSSKNSPKPVLIFWSSMQCLYIHC